MAKTTSTTVHDRFSSEELAKALSHFDIGIIGSVREFPRGSRRSPKVIINAQRGKYLFKRRSKGKADLAKVAFTHQIQLWLAAQNFPLPHLIGTRNNNNSMLVMDSSIYELFEYIEGGPYDASEEATFHSGRILALYHKLLADFRSDYAPPTASYHNAMAIHKAIRNTVRTIPSEKLPSTDVLQKLVDSLEDAYHQCATKIDQAGLGQWPSQIVHGDWHRGNMLFRDRNVVAVIDYDSARLHQRIIDLSNGAMQFSIIRKNTDPSQWPDNVDMKRYKKFVRGYDSVNVISVAELKTIPLLMCESIIAEASLPIGTTGSIGHMEGFGFLQMVDRKVKWILSHLDELHKTVISD